MILYQYFICGFKYYIMKGSKLLYYTKLTIFCHELVKYLIIQPPRSLTTIRGQYSLLAKMIAQV